MFSRSDLDELLEVEAEPAVSLYLPTHPAGREVRQDPIRLKNLLSSTAERLAASRRKPEIDALLAPAEAVVGNDGFWRQQEQGLAVFLAPAFYRAHKLPVPVSEKAHLAAHLHIEPLLPLLEDAGPFWLLTISAAHTRLFQGSRWSLAEVEGLDLPQGVGTIRGITEYEETRYGSSAGRRGGLAKAQSFGDDPDRIRKEELLQLLRRIVTPVEPLIKRRPAPVILAAHPRSKDIFGRSPVGKTSTPTACRKTRTPLAGTSCIGAPMGCWSRSGSKLVVPRSTASMRGSAPGRRQRGPRRSSKPRGTAGWTRFS